MVKTRKTVDNDNLTVVVTSAMLGFARRISLVRDYKTKKSLTLLSSELTFEPEATAEANTLAKQLNVKVVFE